MHIKKVYNGDAPVWLQHAITIIATLIAATAISSVAWTQMENQVDNNQARSEKNGSVLEGFDDRLDSLETGLALLQQKTDKESMIQEEYREDTKRDLRSIMRSLSGNNPPR